MVPDNKKYGKNLPQTRSLDPLFVSIDNQQFCSAWQSNINTEFDMNILPDEFRDHHQIHSVRQIKMRHMTMKLLFCPHNGSQQEN